MDYYQKITSKEPEFEPATDDEIASDVDIYSKSEMMVKEIAKKRNLTQE